MRFAISDEAFARVYSAAYSSSVELKATTATARSNAREAVMHFVQVMHEIHGEQLFLPNDQQQGETQ